MVVNAYVDVLTWPPESPNLNPIVHVWALMKWKLNELATQTKDCSICGSMRKLLSIPSHLTDVKSSIIACPITSKLLQLLKEGGQIY